MHTVLIDWSIEKQRDKPLIDEDHHWTALTDLTFPLRGEHGRLGLEIRNRPRRGGWWTYRRFSRLAALASTRTQRSSSLIFKTWLCTRSLPVFPVTVGAAPQRPTDLGDSVSASDDPLLSVSTSSTIFLATASISDQASASRLVIVLRKKRFESSEVKIYCELWQTYVKQSFLIYIHGKKNGYCWRVGIDDVIWYVYHWGFDTWIISWACRKEKSCGPDLSVALFDQMKWDVWKKWKSDLKTTSSEAVLFGIFPTLVR